MNALEPYWAAIRRVYAPFESGLPSPTGRVYRHEIPDGQLSNLRQQAIALGLGERFEQIEDMYAAADDILGSIPKVTPSSKVIGDLALALVGADPTAFAADPAAYDIPASVIGFLHGKLGDPPGGWPEPFRSEATARQPWTALAGELTPADKDGLATDPRATLNRLFPGADTGPSGEARARWGDVSVLRTLEFLYGLRFGEEHRVEIEEGKQLYLGLQAIGEPDERGFRTVMCTLNGQLRPLTVRDRSVTADTTSTEKADPAVPGQVPAPFQGVVAINVAAGDHVTAGDVVATIEAMKMEATITTPIDGTVRWLAFSGARQVEAGDLLLVLG